MLAVVVSQVTVQGLEAHEELRVLPSSVICTEVSDPVFALAFAVTLTVPLSCWFGVGEEIETLGGFGWLKLIVKTEDATALLVMSAAVAKALTVVVEVKVRGSL